MVFGRSNVEFEFWILNRVYLGKENGDKYFK